MKFETFEQWWEWLGRKPEKDELCKNWCKEAWQAATAAERAECAKLCDKSAERTFSSACQTWGDYFARAIRARGNGDDV